MKNRLQSYLTFNRSERFGIVILGVAILSLIVVRATMSLWVHQVADTTKEQKLVAAWKTLERAKPLPKKDSTTIAEHEDASDEYSNPLPNLININTADSATLVRLKGIGPVTVSKIMKRRAQKPFTDINQLSEVGSFSKKTLALLRKHLVFKTK